jgi:four helix bundle protein
MDKHELERRTKKFAVDVIGFVGNFERSAAARVIANQLLKSATSVGANYREANRSLSRREFTHKITLVEKEASETEYWLELCIDCALGDAVKANGLLLECRELVAIFTAIGRSMRASSRQTKISDAEGVSESVSSEYGECVSGVGLNAVDALIPAFENE